MHDGVAVCCSVLQCVAVCHMYECMTALTVMHHGTHMDENECTRHIYECIKALRRIQHAARMHVACHTCECMKALVEIQYGTHMNGYESWYVTYMNV